MCERFWGISSFAEADDLNFTLTYLFYVVFAFSCYGAFDDEV